MTESKSDENEPSERPKPAEAAARTEAEDGEEASTTNGSARLEKKDDGDGKPGEDAKDTKDAKNAEDAKDDAKTATTDAEKEKANEKDVELFPRGNRLNVKRGLPTIFAG